MDGRGGSRTGLKVCGVSVVGVSCVSAGSRESPPYLVKRLGSYVPACGRNPSLGLGYKYGTNHIFLPRIRDSPA